LAADLSEGRANEAAIAAALERFGRLDAVMPNAGFQYVAPSTSFQRRRGIAS
jgi:3-hydroxybutyrate dehydrogenase